MNWFNIGLTIDTLGKVMIGITVLMVHRHVFREHKIDKAVFKAMRWEQIIGVAGIVLIVIGFFLQLPTKL